MGGGGGLVWVVVGGVGVDVRCYIYWVVGCMGFFLSLLSVFSELFGWGGGCVRVLRNRFFCCVLFVFFI